MIRTPVLRRFYSTLPKPPVKPYKPSPPRPRPQTPESPTQSLEELQLKPRYTWKDAGRAAYREQLRPAGKFVSFAIGFLLVSHLVFAHIVEISGTYGASMLPTMDVQGVWVLINKRCRRGKNVEVGDLVAANHPLLPGEQVIKRIVGMPGDFVMADSFDTSGKMIQVPQGHCFIAGDNQLKSRDSRHYGPIPLALIRGKAIAKVLPLRDMGWLENTMIPIPDDEID